MYVFRKCRLIPPHLSRKRQAACDFFLRGGSLPYAVRTWQTKFRETTEALRSNRIIEINCFQILAFLSCCVRPKGILKRLPLGGKLSRKRLMRGDQSPPAQRLRTLTPRSLKECEAAPCKEFAPPVQTQNFPTRPPPLNKSKRNFRFVNGGVLWGSSR